MTLGNVLRLDLNNENRAKYNANAEGKRISEVIIDGVSIKGFSAFSFVRKLSYVKSPYRSSDGSLGNLNAYPVIIVPQLQIDFSLLFIDDYRAIMRLVYERREHIVQCYDVVQDKRVTERMYFEPEELPKLFTITRELQGRNENSIELLGVQDYTVVMVGTNNPKDAINIIYLDHNGNQIQGSQQQITSYEDVLIGENVSVEQSFNDKVFDNKWERIGTTSTYLDKQDYTLTLITDSEKNTNIIYFKPIYK